MALLNLLYTPPSLCSPFNSFIFIFFCGLTLDEGRESSCGEAKISFSTKRFTFLTLSLNIWSYLQSVYLLVRRVCVWYAFVAYINFADLQWKHVGCLGQLWPCLELFLILKREFLVRFENMFDNFWQGVL